MNPPRKVGYSGSRYGLRVWGGGGAFGSEMFRGYRLLGFVGFGAIGSV